MKFLKFQHSYKVENGNFPEQGNDTLAPDKWGDYPHHYGKSHAIAKLWMSRFGYLNRQYKKLKWKIKRK
jgi:hypothetical protein